MSGRMDGWMITDDERIDGKGIMSDTKTKNALPSQ
jgi:hypothetical protein